MTAARGLVIILVLSLTACATGGEYQHDPLLDAAARRLSLDAP